MKDNDIETPADIGDNIPVTSKSAGQDRDQPNDGQAPSAEGNEKWIIRFIRREYNEFTDSVRKNPGLLITLLVCIVIGWLLAVKGLWNYLEPVITTITMGLAFWIWYQTRKVEASAPSQSRKKAVIAVEVGRPVTEAVKEFFGIDDENWQDIDFAVIEVNSLIGKSELTSDEDYELMTKRIYSKIASNVGKEIHLFLSGPLGLAFNVGRMAGLNKFDIAIYQHYEKVGYKKLKSPSRDWLSHR